MLLILFLMLGNPYLKSNKIVLKALSCISYYQFLSIAAISPERIRAYIPRDDQSVSNIQRNADVSKGSENSSVQQKAARQAF